jgi:predicted nuclease of predicted toxin-antitoxin system
MRILADENVPGPVVTALREAGHDVLWTKEGSPGARDRDARG